MPAIDAWDPNPDLEAAARLRDALRAVRYSTKAIEELLGEDGPSADLAESVLYERRLPESRIATAIKLLLLQRPVSAGDAAAALGDDAVAALQTLGYVVDDGAHLVPRARIV